MSSEQVQHFASFFFAIGFDAVSENDLVARLVHTLFESKAAALFGLLQCPSCKTPRALSDLCRSVAAVDSECVQFHKLAPVVFIQAGTPSLALLYDQRTVSCAPAIVFRNSVRNFGVRSHAQPIVQIEQHRRTLRSRDQQVLKFSQRMRANHVPLIAGQQVAVGALADEYVEAVEPKVGHHFLQLTLAVDGPQQLGLHQFVKHNLLWIIQRSEEHTSELQSQSNLVCRLLLEKKKKHIQ